MLSNDQKIQAFQKIENETFIDRVKFLGTKHFLKESLFVGGATLATAYALKGLYRSTDFYPPNAIFYFFIGVGAHAAFELAGGNKAFINYRLKKVSE